MKLTRRIIIHSLLLIMILCSASCLSTEWGKQGIDLMGYTIFFEMPKPFAEKTATVALPTGRTPWEVRYTNEGNGSITYNVRKMDLPVGAWEMDGFNRRAILDLGLSREATNKSDRIVDRQDYRDENWPDQIKLSEELTVESADGKTVKHIRMLLAEREMKWAYVIFSAARPKDSSRSPDIDKFLNSLKICTGDQRPGRC